MTSATTRFLSTPELLEALFLQCDMRSLLTVIQRVCKQWHEVICEIPSIQRHLFLRPAKADSSLETVKNPLLSEVFPPFFDDFSDTLPKSLFGREDIERLPLAQHTEIFMRREATWRRMHVQQPPLRVMGVSRPSDYYAVIYEQPVDMGMLYDHVMRLLISPQQLWGIWWKESFELRDCGWLSDEYKHECTRMLLPEVDAVLVRSSASWESITVRPIDREFTAKFAYPGRLRSHSIESVLPKFVAGRLSRSDQREL
ncbi:hypothetical protein F4779DRAFT_600421 [Xylariaceae sp. FL0662B]|nr:hypothetical protein F4779DRAFT_600421 [Xylariaceae sp. FL0662B]